MFEPKGRVRAGAWAKKRMQRAENTACFHTHLIKTERTVEMYEWVANDYLTVSKICHIHRNLLLFHLNKCILGIQLVCKCAKVTLAKTGEVSNFVI